MPCLPNIWERIGDELPRIGMLASVIGYIALVVVLIWAPKLHRRWLRITSRVLGAAAAIPIVIMGPALALGLLFASGDPPTVTRTVRSQDGQEARVSYDAGFLGRDYTEVALKAPCCCPHTTVFRHDGPSSIDDVQVEWVDTRHLHLTYHARSSDYVQCEPRFGEVTIVCTSLGWPYN